MKVEITNTKERVKNLLIKYPVLRDNDNRLIANIWAEDFKAMGITGNRVEDFLSIVAQGLLTNTESIRRCRAKIQEEYRELSGNKNYRKKREPEIQSELFNR